MIVRRAGAEDLSTIIAIERGCFNEQRYSRETVLFMLTDEAFATFLVEDRLPIGSASVHVEGEDALLVSIGVVAEHRCKGAAKVLMEAVEREARSRGAARIALQVSILNVPAMNMYLHLGYRTEGILKGYYGQGKDAYYMVKAL